jgi:hypothetical protein
MTRGLILAVGLLTYVAVVTGASGSHGTAARENGQIARGGLGAGFCRRSQVRREAS